ncbi:MAG TPA: TMEM43 family protein [Syntrophobacter fumaroxidans]|nr:TMEM43 family protein [Syntrophobacter fumaroxidans]
MADEDSITEVTQGPGGGFSGGDTYTEVTRQSLPSKIGSSFGGLFFGLILVIAGIVLLFWNEGRTVKTHRALEEGAAAVVSAGPETVNAVNQGKLVHMTGQADSDATLADPEFGISAKALRLKRSVEMYQWKEDEKSESQKNSDGSTTKRTTYSYRKVWSSSRIDSSRFKKQEGHSNPAAMPYREKVFDARTRFGAFTLPPTLVAKIPGEEDLPVPDPPATVPASLQGKARVHEGAWYVGQNPQEPAVGDVKVRFRIKKPGTVSVIAKQWGNTFEPYITKNGREIELVAAGAQSPETMFAHAVDENKTLSWILRGVGFLVIFIGLLLVLNPFVVLLDAFSFLGNIFVLGSLVQGIQGLVAAGIFVVSLILGLILALVTIAIAWMFYRPLLAVLLIAAAVGLLFGMRFLPRRGRIAQQSASA